MHVKRFIKTFLEIDDRLEACSNLSDIRTISHPKLQRGLIAKIMTFQKIGQLEINYEEIIRLQPDNLTFMFKTGHKLF